MEGVDFSVKRFLLKDINMLDSFLFFSLANNLLGELPFQFAFLETCLIIVLFLMDGAMVLN